MPFDTAFIAHATRALSHAVRSIQLVDENVVELSMLCGFDDDVLGRNVATSNRIRGFLTQIHPALERVLAQCGHWRQLAGASRRADTVWCSNAR
ncbi:hypothetical protein E3T53_00940 [Cryobacterium psychrophilum]|uniref:Transposase IS110-like N-terminal domain-containing protein n=1 Tax=Cryobacterium psychrophilum TaxID=41988 RepID=A0A4Y8KS63_9MICO|nr:hypothetical protein E3T53_00940 [Cryobacterium psychrophilum]